MVRRIGTLSLVWLALFAMNGCSEKPVLDEAAVNLVDARDAIAQGETKLAKQLLDSSVAARPNTWAYYERARLLAEEGDEAGAQADIESGLELDPEHAELLWLEKQLKKSKRTRFKGKYGMPPSTHK